MEKGGEGTLVPVLKGTETPPLHEKSGWKESFGYTTIKWEMFLDFQMILNK